MFRLGDELRYFVEPTDVMRALKEALLDQKPSLVQLVGVGGSGKTTIARAFASRFAADFRGDVFWAKAREWPRTTSLSLPQNEYEDPRVAFRDDALLIVDDCDPDQAEALESIQFRHFAAERASTLLIGRTLPLRRYVGQTITVRGLDNAQVAELFAKHGLRNDPSLSQLIRFAEGHPLSAELLAAMVSQRDAASVLAELRRYQRSGLVDDHGRPLDRRSMRGRQLVTDAREVNRELLGLIGRTPDLVYQVDPRRFEEITAELFASLGYEVELTPASKDGGRDLHVARKGPLGSLLFYVECKRYAPDNPVGVGLVRALHGTVQADKATAGLLLTTSRFTRGAEEFQAKVRHQLSLADYVDFQAWMSDAGFRLPNTDAGEKLWVRNRKN